MAHNYMKNMLKLFSITAAFGFLFMLSTNASGQVAGGYKTIDTTDEGVTAAADFARQTQAEKTNQDLEIVRVAKAERQVVAGINYRMCLVISDGENQYTVTTVVYVDLKQNKKLTSWAKAACAPAEEEGDD